MGDRRWNFFILRVACQALDTACEINLFAASLYCKNFNLNIMLNISYCYLAMGKLQQDS